MQDTERNKLKKYSLLCLHPQDSFKIKYVGRTKCHCLLQGLLFIFNAIFKRLNFQPTQNIVE